MLLQYFDNMFRAIIHKINTGPSPLTGFYSETIKHVSVVSVGARPLKVKDIFGDFFCQPLTKSTSFCTHFIMT